MCENRAKLVHILILSKANVNNESVIHTALRSFSSTINPVNKDMSNIDMVASLSADRYLWSHQIKFKIKLGENIL